VDEFSSIIQNNPERVDVLRRVIDRVVGGDSVADAIADESPKMRTWLRDAAVSLVNDLEKPGRRKRKASTAPLPTTEPGEVKPGLVITAFSDGGSRGNPGESACATVLYTDGEELMYRARRIGVATNNVAEYRGVILALELCVELRATEVKLKIDSELVVKQIHGQYKVKHPDLKPLFQKVRLLADGFERFSVRHVAREENKRADEIVNLTLDGKLDQDD